MLDTSGCCACEEMGALLAGVFCGVLARRRQHRNLGGGAGAAGRGTTAARERVHGSARRRAEGTGLMEKTYGAVFESGRLLRMGSAMVMDSGRARLCVVVRW